MASANIIIASEKGSLGLREVDIGLLGGCRHEQDMTAQISKTEDAMEARPACAEKRAPVFRGR